jgi:hypothetical protein
MFHTYVRGVHGQQVDFDRASWLMDRELLEEAKALRASERPTPRDPDTMAQRVWNTYCALHGRNTLATSIRTCARHGTCRPGRS